MARSQAEKYSDVIVATLAAVDERGVDGVRLRDIAERASVSKGWIISVLESRSGLIAAAVCTRFTDRVAQSLALVDSVARSAASADDFIGIVSAHRRRGEHTLDREEVWQFLEMIVWSFTDPDAAVAVHLAQREIVSRFERVTATFDDRGWLHPDVGPLSTAVLLMASLLARVFFDEPADDEPGDDSLLLVTLTALLGHEVEATDRGDSGVAEPDSAVVEWTSEPEDSRSETRARILSAATQELIDRGPLDFRIQTVIDGAGVSSSVLYTLFTSRDDLVRHAGRHMAVDNRRAATTIIGGGLAVAPAGARSGREHAVAALRAVFDVVRTSGSDRLALGLTSLVTSRLIDTEEQFAQRKLEYFGTVARMFAGQVAVPEGFEPRRYAPIGPLGFFMMVVVVNHPDLLDVDETLAPAFVRVVESMLALA